MSTALGFTCDVGTHTNFGYDAVVPKNRRKPPSGLLRSEDRELLAEDRRRLVSTSRDTTRNFAIAGWMIRCHLDYVTTFSFQAKTGNAALDKKISTLIAERGKGRNCDAGGRHGIKQIMRIAESRRCIDHDVFLMRINDGSLQPIEGDRVRTPIGDADNEYMPQIDSRGQRITEWVQGVQINPAGRPLSYAVHRRGNAANLFILDRLVPAENIYHHATFERFDQVRGVSPLAAALNTLRDAYEGFDYALAKMKVSQLFGLSVFRDAPESFGSEAAFTSSSSESDAIDSADDQPVSSGYKVDFNQGPFVLDMQDGDRAEFLESKSPSLEFQAFSQVMIAVALKSLDIPYSFYAENFTNYSGSRGARIQYEQSAEIKREENVRFLDWWTEWQLGIAIDDGYFEASEAAQILALDDGQLRWVPRGTPWLDPIKEVTAELRAVDGLLDNPERIARSHNRDVYENIDAIARVREYAASKGVAYNTMPPLPSVPVPTDKEQPISGDQQPDSDEPDEEDNV